MLRAVLALTAGSVVLCSARTALPCSPPLPGFYEARPDTSAPIPKNAVVAVAHYGVNMAEASVVEVDFIYRPVMRRVHYDLWLAPITGAAGGVPISLAITGTGEQPIEPFRRTYDVDTREDTTPPVFAHTPVATAQYTELNAGLCQGEGFFVSFTVDPATDDFGIAYYLLHQFDGSGDAVDSTVVASHLAYRPDDPVTIGAYAGTEEGRRCYFVSAYDFAGLETASPTVCVDLKQEPTSDGGVVPRHDGGGGRDAGTDAGPQSDSGTGGLELEDASCGCSSVVDARAQDGPALFALLVLGLACVLRRGGFARR